MYCSCNTIGVINNISKSCSPFGFTSFKATVHAVCWHCQTLLTDLIGTEPSLIVLITPVDFLLSSANGPLH